VRTLAIRFTIFDFTLVSPPAPLPNAGSEAEDADHPMRARKRSSERIAIALVTRTMTEETWLALCLVIEAADVRPVGQVETRCVCTS